MGDLISREALKKACSEMVRGSNNSDFIPCPTWNNAMELIDNAPTVEVDKLILIVAKQHGKREMMLNALRPHGEWIKNAEEWQQIDPPYFCSECGHANLRKTPFCEMCGADMKGGEEE